ncbi:ATP-binding protein [Gellertiella hungarica]|uniref:Uncharacterized protein YhaN n=1 Tax=Gellertiella hungarica TaxID=1572859 RepID=A0A7W6J3L0_9HYPH|nr:AAA family ATPase [Gellertiella hungarica]MBB4063258.1 uncharacterized protein YhaN [Gellertiella hungarica]
MRLRRLDLTRYGKFTDVSLDFGEAKPGSPDLTIVYGLNEAGKSTAFSAYLDFLFGIPERSGYDFLHAYSALQVGGVLEFDGAAHELARIKKRTQSLIDAQAAPVNEALLQPALGGIGRDAYRTMFSLDDQSLREGGKSILQSEGDLGALLFSASAGLADLGRALGAMEQEAEQIHRHRGQKTELARLKRELDGLREKRAEIDVQAAAFSRLVSAAAQAETTCRAAEDELTEVRGRESALTRLLNALPLARDVTRTRQALLPLAGLPRPPQAVADRLPSLLKDETRLETALSSIESRIAALRKERDQLAPDEKVLALDARIGLLDEARARFRTAETDLPRRRQALVAEEAALSMALRALGHEHHPDPASLILEAPLVGRIRDLIARKSGIDTALRSTARELERATASLAALEAEAGQPDAVPGAELVPHLSGLLEALARVETQQGLEAEERHAERLARELSEILAALKPLGLDATTLNGTVFPDRRQLDSWREAASALLSRRNQHLEAVRSLKARIADGDEQARSIVTTGHVADDETAAALRVARDRLWQAHLDRLDRESALLFERALQDFDRASETRLEKAGDLARLREISRTATLDRAALAREEQALAAIDAEETALSERIAALSPKGLLRTDLPLAEGLALAASLAERASEARMTAAALGEARERLERTGNLRATACRELAEALSACGERVPQDASPSMLRSLAGAAIERSRRREAERTQAARRESELRAEIAERQRDHQEAERAASAWTEAWATALERTWFEPGLGPEEVRALIDALADLPGRLRERDTLRQRIQTMEEDQQNFASELSALHDLAGMALPEGGTATADQALLSHHAEARRQAEAAARIARDLAELEEERARLRDEQALHAASREKLLQAFGCDDLEEAGQRRELMLGRDNLESRLQSLEEQLLQALGTNTADAALEALAGIDEEATRREQRQLADRIDLLSAHSRDLYGEWMLARNRLDAVGGDGAVAALEAERATLLLTIEDLAWRYLKLKTGALAAGSALDLYREKHRSSMMRRASEAFRQITRGDYTGLTARADRDRETLIGLTREGGSRLTDAMSTGTRYQLYLALRVAGYEEFAAVRPPVPFIADDIMETFDEPRSEEVFRLFGEMARIGQVIYLTHHRHLCEIARTVVPEVRIITL